MLTSFACMFHFSLKLLFGFKIPMTFISIVTYAYSFKKSHNQVENFNMCGVFIECLSIYDFF